MPTEDQNRQQMNEKVESIKKKTLELKQQNEKALRLARANAEADQRKIKRMQEHAQSNNGKNTNEKGEPVNEAGKLQKQGEALRNFEASTFKDWRANMFEILSFLLAAGKHFNKSENRFLRKKYDLIKDVYSQKRADRDAPTTLPEGSLGYYMEMGDDKVLILSAGQEISGELDFSENPDFEKSIDEDMKSIVQAWLKTVEPEKGYTINEVSGESNKFKIVDNNGNEMDQVKFEELRTDPENGLDAFLENEGLINVNRPSSAPRPSPFSS